MEWGMNGSMTNIELTHYRPFWDESVGAIFCRTRTGSYSLAVDD